MRAASAAWLVVRIAMKLGLLLFMTVVACSKDPGPATSSAAAPAGAYGWWLVGDGAGAEDIRGGYVKLEPARMAIVGKDRRVASRTCKTRIEGAKVTITGCGPSMTGTLDGDRLDFGTFAMTRVPAAQTRELDALALRGADACNRARACYREAWPALGRKVDEESDFGPGPSASTCQNMLAAFADELRKAGKPLGACGP